MKILITAFEPFGGRDINASVSVLDDVSGFSGGDNLIKATLPVDHNQAPAKLIGLIEEHNPDSVICMGEAGKIDWIQLEHVAINWMDFRLPDNGGNSKVDQKINENGETAYFSSLPLRNIEMALKKDLVPVKISMSAGTYLCNQIFYNLMEILSQQEKTIPAGFIHLPSGMVGGELTVEDCDLETAVKGVNLILKTLVS